MGRMGMKQNDDNLQPFSILINHLNQKSSNFEVEMLIVERYFKTALYLLGSDVESSDVLDLIEFSGKIRCHLNTVPQG